MRRTTPSTCAANERGCLKKKVTSPKRPEGKTRMGQQQIRLQVYETMLRVYEMMFYPFVNPPDKTAQQGKSNNIAQRPSAASKLLNKKGFTSKRFQEVATYLSMCCMMPTRPALRPRAIMHTLPISNFTVSIGLPLSRSILMVSLT